MQIPITPCECACRHTHTCVWAHIQAIEHIQLRVSVSFQGSSQNKSLKFTLTYLPIAWLRFLMFAFSFPFSVFLIAVYKQFSLSVVFCFYYKVVYSGDFLYIFWGFMLSKLKLSFLGLFLGLHSFLPSLLVIKLF